ncbi:MAG: 3-hydroxyacyl-ACP dehydratase FabZ family protein [Candidatus Brocadiia bacterium]
MPAPPIIDPASLDLAHVAYDIDAIRQVNPQRHEMEQLTAIVLMDPEQQLIVAYKDVTDQEFWVRGHIPGRPLMPGVVMCEAVAQAASFLIHHCMDGPPGFIGFGGMDGVRFRGTVSPGDRLLIMGRIASLRRRIAALEGQGFVGQKMVFEGTIIGVPM